MKYLKTLLLCCLLPITSAAQNLVPNYSFEDTIQCPGTVIENAIPWFNPTDATPDHFHECNNFTFITLGVPSNYSGYQVPRTGVAYAGLIPLWGFDSREYIEIKMSDPLIYRHLYCVAFYVSLADDPNFASAIDRLGAALTAMGLMGTGTGPLNHVPEVANPRGNFIADTSQWTPVSGVFQSRGGERFITIGNFYNNDSTDYIGGTGGSYYYIDDVSVYEMVAPPLNHAGRDTAICPGDSALLGKPPKAGFVYSWQPAPDITDTTLSQQVVAPTQTTAYILTATDTAQRIYTCRAVVTDTVLVTVINCDTVPPPPPPPPPPDEPNTVFIPNIFSPNNDGSNDVFAINGVHIVGIELHVYNRLGELVFATSDPSATWDGSFRGQPLNSGVFVYRCHIVFANGEERDMKGNVTLVR